MNTQVTYAVEYAVPNVGSEWQKTQETDDLEYAKQIEKFFHQKDVVARIIERTTTERYLSKYDLGVA